MSEENTTATLSFKWPYTCGFKGKRHTEETKKRISDAKRGKRWNTDDEIHEKKLESTRQWRRSPAGVEWMREYNSRPSVRARQYELKKSDRGRALEKARRDKIRDEALVVYGGSPPKCSCCGEKNREFLSIDHINGGGRQHKKEINTRIESWLRSNGWPEGFRILCHNCNFSKGKYGYCPHRNLQEDKIEG